MAANPQRTKQIRRAALEALKPASPYGLPESTMLSFVDDLVKPPLSEDERKDTLGWLGVEGFARPMAGALDPAAREWVITELGKSLLASL
jgi:hypothetical protein